MTNSAHAPQRPVNQPWRDHQFMTLWSCVAAAFLAQWMVPVAAQWFLLERPGGKELVPMVQVALTLPIALLVIPVGVLADRVDRRRFVLVVQAGTLVVEVVLVTLTMSHSLSSWGLLTLTALLSCGIAGTYLPLNSMVPDLVGNGSIQSASAMLAVATNATRVIGPVVAGVVLAASGVALAFAVTVPATCFLLVALIRLRSTPRAQPEDDRWLSAARTGMRFMRHSPQALKLILRTLWFSVGIMGLLSLLPLIADRYGANSEQLGLLFAMQGLGAVLGAASLSSLGRLIGPNHLATSGFAVGAVGLLLAAVAPGLVVLGLAVLSTGWAWTTLLGSNHTEMQIYLPAWVRARGLAILLMATYIGQALGSYGAGWLADVAGVRWSLAANALLLLGGTALGLVLPLKDLHDLDRSAFQGWVGSEFITSQTAPRRHLHIRTRYEIPAASRHHFLEAMISLRRVRLRTGAHTWHLLEDSQRPGRFFEEYFTVTLREHELQRKTRLTASDRDVEVSVKSLSSTPPETRYAFRKDIVAELRFEEEQLLERSPGPTIRR